MILLPPTGRYEFKIDAYLTDFRGKATLPMICNFMLQAATKHAEERGFGYSHMESIKRIWVLTRLAIEVYKYPDNNSTLIINTWASDVNRLFAERMFSLETIDGEKIGFATSLWSAINWETRKPSNVLELKELLTMTDKQKTCPIKNVNKIPSLKENSDIIDEFTIKYSDVDINKHLNSMKHIEHFINVFDINLFKKKEIQRIEVNYLAEGKYGTSIAILQKKENDMTYILEMKNKNTTISTSRIIWK